MTVKQAVTGEAALDAAAAGDVVVLRVYSTLSLEVEGSDVEVALTNNQLTGEDPASLQWKVQATDLTAGTIHELCYGANYVRLTAKGGGCSVWVGLPGSPGRSY